MKKVFAAFLSAILGIFGFAVVDRTIEGRVARLEAEVSSLEALHNTTWPTYPTTETTTTIPATTTVIDADGYTVLPCPQFSFVYYGSEQARITLTEYKYKVARAIEKSDDPKNVLEVNGGVVYSIKVKGSVPVEFAGLYLSVYRTNDLTGSVSLWIAIDGNGEFAAEYEHCRTSFEESYLTDTI